MAAERTVSPPPLRLLERPARRRTPVRPAPTVPAWWQRWLPWAAPSRR